MTRDVREYDRIGADLGSDARRTRVDRRGSAVAQRLGLLVLLFTQSSCSWTPPAQPPLGDRSGVELLDAIETVDPADLPPASARPRDVASPGPVAILPGGRRVPLETKRDARRGEPPVEPSPMALLPSGERVPLSGMSNEAPGSAANAPSPQAILPSGERVPPSGSATNPNARSAIDDEEAAPVVAAPPRVPASSPRAQNRSLQSPAARNPAARSDAREEDPPLALPRPGPIVEGGPRLNAILPERARRPEVSVEYTIEGHRSRVERIEMWVTGDGGQHWRLHAYDPDCTSPFDLDLPDGEWGVRWVVTTERERSAYPEPGDPPREIITVDSEPPRITFGTPHVWAEAHGPGGDTVGIELPFQVDDAHLDHRSIRCDARIGDGPWRLVEAPEGIARATLQAGPNPVRIRVTARDRFGHSGSREEIIRPADRLVPPSVAFIDAPGEWVGGGGTVELHWEGRWPSSPDATATIEFAIDGSDWRAVATDLPVTGTHAWRVPRIATRTGELRVRLVGDAPRGRSPLDVVPIAIDTSPPIAQIVAPIGGEGSQIPILIEAGDAGGSEIAQLELHRHDGKGWVVATVAEVGPSILFDPPTTGLHHLWVVARDGAGLESAPPPADPRRGFAFTARSTDHRIRLLSFRDGGHYPPGGRQLVFFEVMGMQPETTVVHLEWSADDGRTWSRRATVSASEGRAPLLLPKTGVDRARVRVIAEEVSGRKTEDRSPEPFRIAVGVPKIDITRVVPNGRGGSEIHFEVEDGRFDAIDKVHVYHRAGRTARWQRWSSNFTPHSPIAVDLPPDSSFELRAHDRLGNRALGPYGVVVPEVPDGPIPGLEPGTIELLTEGGREVAGGSSHYIFWRTSGSLPAPTARLEQRIGTNGPWFEVDRDLPGTGRLLWTAPDGNGAEVWLRLVTSGPGGEVVAAMEEPFLVDDRLPQVLAVGPATSRGRVTQIEMRVASGEDLDRIELWVRAAERPTWEKRAEHRADAAIAIDLPDGRYHVSAVGVDRAGNRSPEPVRGAEGQLRLIVDTVPPILAIDESEERKRVFHRGQSLVIRPRAHDAHLSHFPITLRVIEQGESEARELRKFHPNATEFHWILPGAPGVHTLEVVAEDLAGNKTIERIPVTVIPTPPRPMLLTDFADRVVGSGEEVLLEWETDGVEPGETTVTIEFAPDGETFAVAFDGQPVDGSIVWRAPALDSNRCRLRLVVYGPEGLRGEVSSGRFTVSEAPPRVRAEGIRPAGSD